jgi:hypothetical protein
MHTRKKKERKKEMIQRWAGGRPSREVVKLPDGPTSWRRRHRTSAPARVAVRSRVQRAVRQAGMGQVPGAARFRLAAATPGWPDATADRRWHRAGERYGGASVPVLLLPACYRIELPGSAVRPCHCGLWDR